MPVIESEVESQQLLALAVRLIKALAAEDHLLKIDGIWHGRELIVNVKASRGDTPRIIGKGGQHFNAIKAIVGQAARLMGLRATFNRLEDPTQGESKPLPRFDRNPDWPREEVERLLRDAALAVFDNVEVVHCRHRLSEQFIICCQLENGPESIRNSRTLSDHFGTLFSAIGLMHGAVVWLTFQQREERPRHD